MTKQVFSFSCGWVGQVVGWTGRSNEELTRSPLLLLFFLFATQPSTSVVVVLSMMLPLLLPLLVPRRRRRALLFLLPLSPRGDSSAALDLREGREAGVFRRGERWRWR